MDFSFSLFHAVFLVCSLGSRDDSGGFGLNAQSDKFKHKKHFLHSKAFFLLTAKSSGQKRNMRCLRTRCD